MILHRLILISLLFITSSVYASDTGYEVELIIFSDNKSRYLDSEDWSYNDMLNQVKEESITEITHETDTAYQELLWDDARLSKEFDKLESNENFTIHINKRWRQTGLDRDIAYSIDITSLKNIVIEEANTENTDTEGNDKPVDLITITSPEEQEDNAENIYISDEIPEPYIDGKIKLVMSRYLHFAVNLNYHRWQNNSLYDAAYKAYPIVSERRMRSKEIHYIDHPLVGIIVLATPFKIEKTEENPVELKSSANNHNQIINSVNVNTGQ